MEPADVAALVRNDMAALRDARVLDHVTELLLTPPRPVRVWVARYSGEVYEGFVVLSHPSSGTSVVYCPRDYDPADPWNLVFTPHESPTLEAWCSGDRWRRFLDVYFESKAVADLAIWRVRERKPGREPEWLSGELSWDEAWGRVKALREASPECAYDCERAVPY